MRKSRYKDYMGAREKGGFAKAALKGLCHRFLASLRTAKIFICVTGNLQIMAYFC